MAKTKKDSAQEPVNPQLLDAAEPLGHVDHGPMAAPPVAYSVNNYGSIQEMRKQATAYFVRNDITLQALFRTLLHELMTGKVRVGESQSREGEHGQAIGH